MKAHVTFLLVTLTAVSFNVSAKDSPASGQSPVPDQVIAGQRASLAVNTAGTGFGPQSPRNIDTKTGNNNILYSAAPAYTEMNLCNIHFHKNAEHAGEEFSRYAGNGNGEGFRTGYLYSGELTGPELASLDHEVCPSEHGSLDPGDTIEVHYVHSSVQVEPGSTLGSCLSDSIKNPQLRVEAQVFVLVNDRNARSFAELADHGQINGRHQALNIPDDTGIPIQYEGSTTGPGYNETGSPYQVSWGVRPKVIKVDIATLGEWCKGNVFAEDHAHGVRNLVTNPDLLSEISGH